MSGAEVSRVEPLLKHGDCVANSTISIDGFLKDATPRIEITDVNSIVVLLPDMVN